MTESVFRIVRYFRRPVVLCGTVHYVSSGISDDDSLQLIPGHFYDMFGKRNWGYIRSVRDMFDGEKFLDDVLTTPSDVPPSSSSLITRREKKLFEMLLLPTPRQQAHVFTHDLEALLEEGKRVVPFILNTSDNALPASLASQYQFHQTASAHGPGFTCTVFKRDPNPVTDKFNVPVYIIAGDLDISVDEFHALACDTEFRKEWDDQFHHVDSEPLDDSNLSLLNWVVKWPWPMSARSYNYLLAPHALDDGTKLVLAASIDKAAENLSSPVKAVPVRAYFGITAARPIGEKKCRYCVFYFDDPRLPGKMPAWVESYVAKSLLPSFPKKIIQGAQKYPQERLVLFGNLSV
jgi:hypothetical protein